MVFNFSNLQALFHIAPFVDWLQNQEEHRVTCDFLYCVTCALQQVFVETREAGKEPVKPEHFVACVEGMYLKKKNYNIIQKLKFTLTVCSAFWKDFVKGRMEDAEEFISLLLLELQKEFLNRPSVQF